MSRPRKALLQVKELRTSLKAQTKNKDLEKIRYLYFDRLFSLDAIQKFFNDKYTYNEVRDIVRGEYVAYYEEEKNNGRQ